MVERVRCIGNRSSIFVPFVTLAISGCLSDGLSTVPEEDLGIVCSIPESEIFFGSVRDAIPALTNPHMAGIGDPNTLTWQSGDRVVGFVLDGQAFAIPLNIFWYHEIVNLDHESHSVAITHCPLTGSSLGFDRKPLGGAEFGVSGLLFENNLIMYDRIGVGESFWVQMARGARCGPKDGAVLDAVPVVEMTWGSWQDLYPETLVVTTITGWDREYDSRGNPYGTYQVEDNPDLLYPPANGLDRRRPPKERGLGVPVGAGGMVFPFGLLEQEGDLVATHETTGGRDFVLFWDAAREAAMAFTPAIDGQPLTFQVVGDQIVDVETGSEWRVTGTAVSGQHEGRALEPVAEAFVAFWFSWPALYPDIEIWSP